MTRTLPPERHQAAGSPTSRLFPVRLLAAGALALGGAGLSGCLSPSPQKLTPAYGEEQRYLGGRPPQVGLALSGGGTRSASFCIGILKGLHQQGVLEQVDAISSVSGGSYASYWFYSQSYHAYCLREEMGIREDVGSDTRRPCRPDDLFVSDFEFRPDPNFPDRTNLDSPDRYRFQRALAYSSRISDYRHEPTIFNTYVANPSVLFFNFCWQIVSMPIHWVTNGVFDWEVESGIFSPARSAYRHGLERSYGYVPTDPSLRRYLRDPCRLGKADGEADAPPTMAEFLAQARHDGCRIPYFIINTTGGNGYCFNRFGVVDGADTDADVPLRHKIYEFTPWSFGSSRFGYMPVKAELLPSMNSLSDVVSASGAAVDAQYAGVEVTGEEKGTDPALGMFFRVANLELGRQMDNPRVPGACNVLHKCLPFPLYSVHDWTYDHLAGQPLSVQLSDGGHSENLGVYSLVRRGFDKIIVVDAECDQESLFCSAMRLKRQLRELWSDCDFVLEQQHPLNVYNTPVSACVVKGKIKRARVECEAKEGETRVEEKVKDIDIVYVKLSLDRSLLREESGPLFGPGLTPRRYPDSIQSLARKDSAFPHNPTYDIFYNRDQFLAYRDLGCYIIMANSPVFRTLVGLPPATQDGK